MNRGFFSRRARGGLLGAALVLVNAGVLDVPFAKADAPACRYASTVDVVVDKETGLVWQRVLDASLQTWDQAKTYCADLPLSGGGWRLPTVPELHTLVDESEFNPTIDANAFSNTPSEFFWSSSAVAGAVGTAWGVSFYYGSVESVGVGSPFPVRCVR